MRIHFTSISISEQTKISQDDSSAWITIGLVPGASLPYPILRQILPRFVDSILLIIDRQNSCHFPAPSPGYMLVVLLFMSYT